MENMKVKKRAILHTIMGAGWNILLYYKKIEGMCCSAQDNARMVRKYTGVAAGQFNKG
jgi:hypothetical protein